MKVKHLIERLEEFDPETPIAVSFSKNEQATLLGAVSATVHHTERPEPSEPFEAVVLFYDVRHVQARTV